VTEIFKYPSYTSGMMIIAYTETNKNQRIQNPRAKLEKNEWLDRLRKRYRKQRRQSEYRTRNV
jgi:hypothetical protein